MPEITEIGLDVAGEFDEKENLIKVVFSSEDLKDCKAEVQFSIDHEPELVFAFVASISEGVKQVLKSMLADLGLYPPEEM